MSWNLNELRDAVRMLHGDAQLELLAPSLNSVVERLYFSQFHYWEFSDCENGLIEGPEDLMGAFTAIFGQDEEKSQLRFKARAHAIASLQSLHSILDTFAHMAYFALAMNKDPCMEMKERDIGIDNVIKKLNRSSDFDCLSLLLNSLNKESDIQHLIALTNHSKHRSVISSPLRLECREDGFFGLAFVEFSYKGNLYPQKRAAEFIKSVYCLIGSTVEQAGREINALLNSGQR